MSLQPTAKFSHFPSTWSRLTDYGIVQTAIKGINIVGPEKWNQALVAFDGTKSAFYALYASEGTGKPVCHEDTEFTLLYDRGTLPHNFKLKAPSPSEIKREIAAGAAAPWGKPVPPEPVVEPVKPETKGITKIFSGLLPKKKL